ncbi:tryptophan-rich sensory protein [Nesterenkonia sp. E16_7]|uniref:TspO/MBR family protein n=1 Tax=unclassified Nesterenkonia TaxID=2629769 RepID=UPI001A92169D|nr:MULTISPECIES: TspO/MBR family protein [unclassified Nesterenkonia]MBO0594941.1 tryptophan-rich sensory protein [Nesterenkonia sp. E16_10]MBO0598596.1 tryptophan-rich sensory protein [Nesterenkonia sp. E16_7]
MTPQARTETWLEPHGSPDSTVKQLIVLILFVGIPQAVGFLGSLLTSDQTDGWYAEADKAAWTPPDAVFGPVWTVLYLLMGVGAWLVWRRRHSVNATPALALFVGQLVLNSIWSPLFFGGYPIFGTAALWAAMVLIVVLMVAIALTIWRFWPISRIGAYLLLPYLAWTLYASTLNFYIALMN